MRRLCTLLFILFLGSNLSFAQSDWSTSIASSIYHNCSSCHHEGGIAPFPLMSYDDAVNNGYSIQSDVNIHKMPPWPADPDYSHFKDERVLSSNEITAINSWVDYGMP